MRIHCLGKKRTDARCGHEDVKEAEFIDHSINDGGLFKHHGVGFKVRVAVKAGWDSIKIEAW
jgi:hypothetical protein